MLRVRLSDITDVDEISQLSVTHLKQILAANHMVHIYKKPIYHLLNDGIFLAN